MTHRICRLCSKEQPLDAFGKTSRGHLLHKCKACYKIAAHEHYEANKDKILERSTAWMKANPNMRRITANDRFIKKYGITIEERNALIERQECKCAICREPFDHSKATRVVIDHCHTNGHVRGVLCRSCNIMLGLVKDSVGTLTNAIAYLNKV